MSLYTSILDTARPFLAGGTEKFINRQIGIHLSVEPHAITEQHLAKLAEWVGISSKLILPKDKAEALTHAIEQLAG